MKVSKENKMEPVKFLKDDEILELKVEKRDQSQILSPVDTNEGKEEVIERIENQNLGIAPRHIKEYEIKKPEEKEPSLLKMISNKIKGNDNSDNSTTKLGENKPKLKDINIEGNK